MISINPKYDTKVEEKSFKEMASFIAKLLGNIHGKLLDIGCYEAFLKEELPSCVEYAGVNLDKTTPFVVEHDLNSGILPFEDEVFDYVVCSNVLEHLFCPEAILKEIKRVMKDSGRGIIILPNDEGISSKCGFLFDPIKAYEEQVYGHHWRFSIESATNFVAKYFSIENKGTHNGIYLKRFDFILKYFPKFSSNYYMIVRKKSKFI